MIDGPRMNKILWARVEELMRVDAENVVGDSEYGAFSSL
jgi:hypothetical protein